MEHIHYYIQTYTCTSARDGKMIMMVLYDLHTRYFTLCKYGILRNNAIH